ncbi:PTS mannose transporter subunit IID [Clostridium sp. 19966]|uniref:mannose/fructose/sorbose PTS transporter subunit IIA n=1 Tax=Clostridium sp. 19966 TaxID=2768166 RepID=UPI0028DE322C|nr:mannose/fructose/sorbose PTS transporter subunit IIA [Clostridium sp. 19966]MDT8718965.1 PTS mannose transporter subunit IID [Clostridium sp. 19966]
MVALIIGTHGRASEEILKSAEMIFGKQENVATVTFETGEGTDDLIRKYNEKLNELDTSSGVIFMVDLFGGSPFNAASAIAAKQDDMDVVTGVNIPMILETFVSRESMDVKNLINLSKEAAAASIKTLKEMLSNSEEEDL